LVVQDPWLTKCLVCLLICQLEFHFPSVLKSTTWSTTGYVLRLYSLLDIRTYNYNAVSVDINMKMGVTFFNLKWKSFLRHSSGCLICVFILKDVLCCKAVELYCIVIFCWYCSLVTLSVLPWQSIQSTNLGF
jgi:hypothetical protein